MAISISSQGLNPLQRVVAEITAQGIAERLDPNLRGSVDFFASHAMELELRFWRHTLERQYHEDPAPYAEDETTSYTYRPATWWDHFKQAFLLRLAIWSACLPSSWFLVLNRYLHRQLQTRVKLNGIVRTVTVKRYDCRKYYRNCPHIDLRGHDGSHLTWLAKGDAFPDDGSAWQGLVNQWVAVDRPSTNRQDELAARTFANWLRQQQIIPQNLPSNDRCSSHAHNRPNS
jgi:hypothetical protein